MNETIIITIYYITLLILKLVDYHKEKQPPQS